MANVSSALAQSQSHESSLAQEALALPLHRERWKYTRVKKVSALLEEPSSLFVTFDRGEELSLSRHGLSVGDSLVEGCEARFDRGGELGFIGTGLRESEALTRDAAPELLGALPLLRTLVLDSIELAPERFEMGRCVLR